MSFLCAVHLNFSSLFSYYGNFHVTGKGGRGDWKTKCDFSSAVLVSALPRCGLWF
jgi:hypothetical protein